jgi:hypothetical protein
MIQRIQSVYLLLIAVLMAVLVCLPLGELVIEGGHAVFSAFGVKSTDIPDKLPSFPLWLIGSLALLSAVISFITIFLFKNRARQTTFCTINGVILGVLYVLYGVFYLLMYKASDASYIPGMTILLPLIGIILDIMAIKGISRDTALVNSVNRIR